MLALNSQRAASQVLGLRFLAQPDLVSFSYLYTGGYAVVSVWVSWSCTSKHLQTVTDSVVNSGTQALDFLQNS